MSFRGEDKIGPEKSTCSGAYRFFSHPLPRFSFFFFNSTRRYTCFRDDGILRGIIKDKKVTFSFGHRLGIDQRESEREIRNEHFGVNLTFLYRFFILFSESESNGPPVSSPASFDTGFGYETLRVDSSCTVERLFFLFPSFSTSFSPGPFPIFSFHATHLSYYSVRHATPRYATSRNEAHFFLSWTSLSFYLDFTDKFLLATRRLVASYCHYCFSPGPGPDTYLALRLLVGNFTHLPSSARVVFAASRASPVSNHEPCSCPPPSLDRWMDGQVLVDLVWVF